MSITDLQTYRATTRGPGGPKYLHFKLQYTRSKYESKDEIALHIVSYLNNDLSVHEG